MAAAGLRIVCLHYGRGTMCGPIARDQRNSPFAGAPKMRFSNLTIVSFHSRYRTDTPIL